ncbi:hypothetical protein ACWCO0_15000 [Streptomyces tubercidicus]
MMSEVRAPADIWGTIARTYIRLTDDRPLPAAMQDRLVAEADALTTRFGHGGSHARHLAEPPR